MTTSIAAIHVAKKQLGLDDDTYRAKLTLITGKASTKDMSEGERQKVLTVFRKDGFQPIANDRRPDGRAKLTGPYAKKLQALWIAGWNLGIFHSPDDAALIAFVKRQTRLDAIRFLRYPDDANKAIEALKAILTRESGVDWAPLPIAEYMRASGYKIAVAQWAKIGPDADFWGVVTDLVFAGSDYRDLNDGEWITVMNAFGIAIRRDKGGAQ